MCQKSLILVTKNNKNVTIPIIPKCLTNYAYLRIHRAGKLYSQEHTPKHLELTLLRFHNVHVTPGASFYSLLLHMKYCHRTFDLLQYIVNRDHIKLPKSHPKKLSPYQGRCPICDMSGITKLPRVPCVDTTELPVSFQWHLDFTFFNTRYIRGFTASLTLVDSTSCMTYDFPYNNKRSPLEIVSWFFNLMDKEG